jgi:hypothetical protein
LDFGQGGRDTTDSSFPHKDVSQLPPRDSAASDSQVPYKASTTALLGATVSLFVLQNQ